MSVYVISAGRDRLLAERGVSWLPQWYGGARQAIDAGPLNPLAIYASQSAVRTVVDFVARNVSSIPLHVYRRVGDTDRVRVGADHPLVRSLAEPMPLLTQHRWLSALVHDALLYDRWAVLKTSTDGEALRLHRIPPSRFRVEVNILGDVTGIRLWEGRVIDPACFLFFAGYADDVHTGTAPMEAIRSLVAELQEGGRYREQLWRNGARVPHVIERPAEAPEWSDTARERFRASWQEWYAGDGSRAGGTPMLEDGMKLAKGEAFSSESSQWLEGRQLSIAEVASFFHIAPEIIGARPGNYSTVREFRQALYRDALGPHLTAFQQTFQAQLVPEFGEPDLYVEPYVEAKLRGSFEEQADYLTRSVGGPYMTRAEARARLNLPHLDGSDELIVPLNVLTGGQANPADSVPDSRRGEQSSRLPGMKGVEALVRRLGTARSALDADLSAFFDRQGRSVLSALGAKAMPALVDAWDSDRWDSELGRLIETHAVTIGTLAALDVLAAYDGEPYDVARVEPYLAKASANNATAMNASTYLALGTAVTSAQWRAEVAAVFAAAASQRAGAAARTITAEAGGFARTDAATGRGLARKTWRTASGKPRPSHAALSGQSVPVSGRFSNGGRWPGDRSLSADERAGCECVLTFAHEEG